MHQKKFALELVAKIAIANGPLKLPQVAHALTLEEI
jgi:hypothetical protein